MTILYLIFCFMALTISAAAQTDIVGEGFKTDPDNVYGVLVGVLIAFAAGCTAFIGWIFKKMFGWVEKYREEKNILEGQKAEVQRRILEQLEASGKVQTRILEEQKAQGRDITEMKGDLHILKGKVDDIEKDVEVLKGRLGQG